MCHELIHDYNFDGAKDLPSDEVEDAYEMMVFLKTIVSMKRRFHSHFIKRQSLIKK